MNLLFHIQVPLDFNESFSHLSYQFREQMNREFLEVVDSLISSNSSANVDCDSDDDIVQVT